MHKPTFRKIFICYVTEKFDIQTQKTYEYCNLQNIFPVAVTSAFTENTFCCLTQTVNTPYSSTTDSPDMLTVLEKIHQELMYLSSALGLQIEEHRYEAVASAVTARQHTWSCSEGQIFEKSCCSK